MMSDKLGAAARSLRRNLATTELPFTDFFTPERVESVIDSLEMSYRDRIFNPLTTLLMFISQALVDGCCRAAVSRVVAAVAASGKKAPSQETGAYCQARKRLPEEFFAAMLQETSQAIDHKSLDKHLWLGRSVTVVDGSSVQTPDTKANRDEWGLPAGVKPGCGFPAAPFVGFFSLVTGMAVGVVIGSKGSSERALYREGADALEAQEVVLSDRGFCSYVDIALLKERAIDAVMRVQKRKPDFSKGKKLGDEDHVVSWTKPVARPQWISDEEFERIGDTLEVRELKIRPAVKGWRTKEIVIVTTLLDEKAYPKQEIAALYLRRWSVELDFRHIKTTLGMEVASTQSPETVRKEIMTYMIGYNMIRALMWRAGVYAGEDPSRLSFAGALQHLKSMSPHLGRASDHKEHARLMGVLYDLIGREVLPDRPGRYEPRVRKRRPKNYRLMTRPRTTLKEEIERG